MMNGVDEQFPSFPQKRDTVILLNSQELARSRENLGIPDNIFSGNLHAAKGTNDRPV